MLTINTILHPTDFSDRSMHALNLAMSLARDHGAKLVLVHVILPPTVAYGEVITGVDEQYKHQMRKELNEVMVPEGLECERILVEGDPATTIIGLAEDLPAELIVMGTHGRTGLGRLLMGSVAEQVVRKANCPVLTLKAPFQEQPAQEDS